MLIVDRINSKEIILRPLALHFCSSCVIKMYIVLLESIHHLRTESNTCSFNKEVGNIVLHKIVPNEKGKAKFELKFISFCHRHQAAVD